MSFSDNGTVFGIKGEFPLNQGNSWQVLETPRQARVLPSIRPDERGRIVQARLAEGRYDPSGFTRRVGVFVDKWLEEMRALKGRAQITKPSSPSPESPSGSRSNPARSSLRPARTAYKSANGLPAGSAAKPRR